MCVILNYVCLVLPKYCIFCFFLSLQSKIRNTKLELFFRLIYAHLKNALSIPEVPKTELLTVLQQLAYNDLTFFCLDGDAEMDAMARITKGRVTRNSDGEHRLIPPKSRIDLGPLFLASPRHLMELPPLRVEILSAVPVPKIM